jgi:ribosomal protein L21
MLKPLLTAILALISSYASAQSGAPVPALAYSPIPTLNKLLAFEKRHGAENYADSFAIHKKFDDDESSGLLQGWTKDPAFLKRVYPFARATGSGSFYAIWQANEGDDVSKSPVVVFGDEGGEHIVAESVDDLLRVLAYDVEPSVDHDKVYFYKSKDHKPSDEHRAFRRWLKIEFNIDKAPHPDTIVKAAKKKYGAAFETWKKRFLQ